MARALCSSDRTKPLEGTGVVFSRGKAHSSIQHHRLAARDFPDTPSPRICAGWPTMATDFQRFCSTSESDVAARRDVCVAATAVMPSGTAQEVKRYWQKSEVQSNHAALW